ncbi:hypothetical protein [Oryzibacter oryziterrae]|uniref:hypothetical protein n=1 Tax=Oryzibacter oryziterrae TaxID=2766474 RepID=UPI001F27A3AF|nr:hypothetical protein [Oryzibacter oryziterrae]
MIRVGQLVVGALLAGALQVSAALAASPQETLVAELLQIGQPGVAVQISGSSFDPTTQSVLIDKLTFGTPGQGDIVDTFQGVTIVRPQRHADGSITAERISAALSELNIHFDIKKISPAMADAMRKQHEAQVKAFKERQANLGQPNVDVPGLDQDPTLPADEVITLRNVAFQRVTLPATRLTIKPDATLTEKALVVLRWMRGVSAERVDSPEVVLVATQGKSHSDITWKGRWVSGMHGLSFDQAHMDSVSEAMEFDGKTLLSAKLGTSDLFGVNYGALIDVIDPATDRSQLPQSATFIRSGRMEDLEVDMMGAKLIVGSMELSGQRVRFAPKSLIEIMTPIFDASSSFKANPEPTVRSMIPAITGLLAQIDSATVKDISFTHGKDVRVELGSLDLHALNESGLGSYAYNKLDIQLANGMEYSLGRFAIEDVKAPDWDPLIDAAIMAKQSIAKQDRGRFVSKLLAGLPQLGHLEYSGFEFTDPAGNVSSASLDLRARDYVNGLPRYVDVALRDFTTPVSTYAGTPTGQWLVDAGIANVNYTVELTLEWDTAKEEFYLKALHLKANDLFDAYVDLQLSKLPASILATPKEELQAAIHKVMLSGASITFANRGVVEKAFEVQAKRMKQDPAKFQKTVANGLSALLPMAIKDKDVQGLLREPLKTFLLDPKSLTVRITPEHPLTLGEVASFGGVDPKYGVAALHPTITVNQ